MQEQAPLLLPGSGPASTAHRAIAERVVKPDERYELIDKVASGSFATVYRAKDLELGREVAVKQIHQQYLEEPEKLNRYWQEAQLLASLQHPNIVTIYDLVREKGWLIMELMQGNLGQRQSGKPMDLTSLRTVLAHSLRALKFLHEHGIIHGDVKPANLMIDRRKRVKLGDFGLARRVSNEEGSLIKGTTKYMAPEVVSEDFGVVGPQSDLYSLGFTAYELMCGKNFESLFPGMQAFGRDKQVAWMMWHAAPDRRLPEISRVLEGVPDDLAKVVQKLTAKNQAERYATADQALNDLKVDLRVVKAGEEDGSEGGTKPDPGARTRRRMIIGMFSASVVMTLAMFFWPSGTGTDPRAGKIGRTGVVGRLFPEENEVELIDDKGVPELLDLSGKPLIYLTNTKQNILFRDIQTGDRLKVDRDKGKGRLRYVISRPVVSHGRMARLDPAARLLVLNVEDGAVRGELPMSVPERADIKLNGDPINDLAKLEPDDRLEVSHVADARDENRQLAESILARRTMKMTGFIKNLKLPGGVMTVELPKSRGAPPIEKPIDPQAKLTLPDGRIVVLADLKEGDLRPEDRVTIQYDTHITELGSRRNKQVAAVVDSIDLAASVVQIGLPDGTKKTLSINDETDLQLGGDAATVGELRKYDEVRVTYDESQPGEWLAIALDATRAIKADRMAILISEQNFQDRTLSRSPHATEDLRLLETVLKKRYGLATERVLVLIDKSKTEIEQAVEPLLKNALRGTQVIVYYNGQGHIAADKQAYLAPRNFDSKNPQETGIPLKWLTGLLEESASVDKLLLLDIAPAVAGADPQREPSASTLVETLVPDQSTPTFETTAVIGAGEARQQNLILPEKKHGLFAWAITQGFRGAADPDRDVRISASDLFEFLKGEMAAAPENAGGKQVPVLFAPAAQP